MTELPDFMHPQQFRTAVQNVRNVHAATPEPVRKKAEHWYDEVHDATAKGVKGTGLTVHGGAGLVAAVSPNMDWEGGNIHALKELHSLREADFHNIARGDRSSLKGMSINSAYGPGLMKAHRILRGEHPDDVIDATKTHNFYKNIAEPHTAGPVTIDGRAYDIARNAMHGWEANRGVSGKLVTPKGTPTAAARRYDAAAEVYRGASKAISEHEGREVMPHQVQAVTWEGGKVIERSAPTKSGRPRKVGPRREGQPYV